MNKYIHISVVTPVYGCAASLDLLHKRLVKTLEKITGNFEIIMVNDASPDNAWNKIKALAKKDKRVKGINLSRNFGQHRAITAGLDYAKGEWVIVMDCDLQDQPEEIIKLYNRAQEGFDIVWARRVERKDTFCKRLNSKLFHIIYDYLTEKKSDSAIANFSIVSNRVILAWKKLREQNRNYPLFIEWLGFDSTAIDVEHACRSEGKSSYTMKKLIAFAIDSIVSQSNKPLKLSIQFGFLVSLSSFVFALYLILRYFLSGIPVAGWTSVMVSIYFIGGLLFANMGFLGLYIGKIFDESKGRPIYIIEDLTFKKED